MSTKQNIITVDGPSGVGKSTISKKIAKATGFVYLDTGAMYRAVGWYLQQKKVDFTDESKIADIVKQVNITLLPAENEQSDVGIMVNGQDISKTIRLQEVAMIASKFSALSVVRKRLTILQRQYGEQGNIVAEGRDMGTVVFPNAAYKFFLDALPEERARRRYDQLCSIGVAANYAEILRLTIQRDGDDRNRALAPLKRASDALLVDTTNKTIEEVTAILLAYIDKIKQKTG
jgi:CMP/dCMP kinase